MAYDLLTTSGINSLISSYINSETTNKITPLNSRKTQYQNLDAAYVTLSGKLNTLSSLLYTLQGTGTSSAFLDKSSTSSNQNFVTATVSGTASAGSYSMRVNQLAQNDLVLSQDPASTSNSTVITAAGTHNFVLTAGDGAGGVLTSNVAVTFNTSDFVGGAITNAALMSKIANAINSNTAVVSSTSVTGSTASSGSFTVDLGGTKTTINYTAGTYSAVMDSLVTQLNAIKGISAQKIINGSNVQLQITVTDNSKYISLGSDTGTLLTELGISNTKEISAAGMVTASVFSPTTTASQLSITAKQSGYDYRIESLTDQTGSQALNSVGLNLGATRQSYVQNTGGIDTPGYVYATTQLNAKLQFNGINIERNSNVITDLVSNVTLNLKSVMQSTDPTVNVTVQNDTTKIKSKIQSFVDTFNDLYKYIKSQTVTTNGTRGVLIGDSNAATLRSMLYSTTTSDVAGLSTTQINSLSKLGITFDINNGLSITNSTQLDNALANSMDQVAAVFNSTNGVAAVLYSRIAPYIKSMGYIDSARSRFSSAIQNLNDTISSKQARINSGADALRNQYIQLQSQLSQLLSMQSYFSSGSSLFG